MTNVLTRSNDRAANDLRSTTIEPHFVKPAAGSALITQGETRVICTASVQESVPRWMAGQGRGWLTAACIALTLLIGLVGGRQVAMAHKPPASAGRHRS